MIHNFVTQACEIYRNMQKDNDIERLLNAACFLDGAHIRHNVAPSALVMADCITEGSVSIPATNQLNFERATERADSEGRPHLFVAAVSAPLSQRKRATSTCPL
jgi:hypothetical protein